MCFLVAVGLLVSACAVTPAGPGATPAATRDILLMASTIGPIDAGIVGALEDAYFTKTGCWCGTRALERGPRWR